MTEKRTVVISRRSSAANRRFAFGPGDVPTVGPLAEVRRQAWEAWTQLPLPSTRDEAWRRTDLRKMPLDVFRLQPSGQHLAPVPKALLQPLTDAAHGGQLVNTPAGAEVRLEAAIRDQGVIFTDWATAEREHGDLLSRLAGQVVRASEGKFAALATAFARQGAFLYVPRGVQLEQPLHSVFWGPGGGSAHFSRLLIWLEDGASATLVHEAASPDEEEDALHAGLVEIHVGAAASLRFVELQSWGRHVWNFSHERARIEADGNLDWVFGAVGSRLSKNFSDLDLTGRGASGRMSGFYFADGQQHFDHDTQQNHFAPDTTSDLLFKGALMGSSRSVWQGMIYVAPGAQKTDGYQANRNLILSEQARADSIPGLEILADDVRCTHGATVGKIDPDEYFYLQSRGIPPREAYRLIVEGFFDPVLQRIPFAGVRERFLGVIDEKMALR